MAGKKTHEQQLRNFERKPDISDSANGKDAAPLPKREGRESKFPVSRGGLNQESREHHKHTRGGQPGHKPHATGQPKKSAKSGEAAWPTPARNISAPAPKVRAPALVP
jgi:hypothetical protein